MEAGGARALANVAAPKPTTMTAQLGRKIAEGREAEVIEWHESHSTDVPKVLKLFLKGYSSQDAQRELAISAAVKVAGGSVPAVFGDVIEHDGRYGVVFERILGTDMLDSLSSRPWNTRDVGRSLGKLHARLHEARPLGLASMKDGLERKISAARELTVQEKGRVIEQLVALPDGDRPCHGDFHPGNVIIRDDDQPVIIDWANAAVGDPMADVARSRLLIETASLSAPKWIVRVLGRWLSTWFDRSYADAYFEASGADPAGVARWRTVIAAARLAEYIPQETEYVVGVVRSRLANAIRPSA